MNYNEIFQNGNPEDEWTVYDDIALSCGKEVAIALFEEFAGVEVKIPDNFDTDVGKMLSCTIGEAAAKHICKTFPGDCFYFPQMAPARRKERKERIIDKLLEGDLSTMEIARIEGISERYVRSIRRAYKIAHPEALPNFKLKTRQAPTQ